MSYFTTTTAWSWLEEDRSHGMGTHIPYQCWRLLPPWFLLSCSAEADVEVHPSYEQRRIFLPQSCSFWRQLKFRSFAAFALLNLSPAWPWWAQGMAMGKISQLSIASQLQAGQAIGTCCKGFWGMWSLCRLVTSTARSNSESKCMESYLWRHCGPEQIGAGWEVLLW